MLCILSSMQYVTLANVYIYFAGCVQLKCARNIIHIDSFIENGMSHEPVGNIFIALSDRIRPKWGIWMVGYGTCFGSYTLSCRFPSSLYQMTSNKSISTDADKTGYDLCMIQPLLIGSICYFNIFEYTFHGPSVKLLHCVNNPIGKVNYALESYHQYLMMVVGFFFLRKNSRPIEKYTQKRLENVNKRNQ